MWENIILEEEENINLCRKYDERSSIKQSLGKYSKKPCSIIDLISIINCIFSVCSIDFVVYTCFSFTALKCSII